MACFLPLVTHQQAVSKNRVEFADDEQRRWQPLEIGE